jgi:hypothetical protein
MAVMLAVTDGRDRTPAMLEALIERTPSRCSG